MADPHFVAKRIYKSFSSHGKSELRQLGRSKVLELVKSRYPELREESQQEIAKVMFEQVIRTYRTPTNDEIESITRDEIMDACC